MKVDWFVTGTVTYKNSEIASYAARWKGLTMDEAERALTKLVADHMRKRNVAGIGVTARASSAAGQMILSKIETKDS